MVELEGLMSSINGHRHRTNCSHSLHQSMLFSTGNVHKASVISCTKLGIIVAGLVILKTEYNYIQLTLVHIFGQQVSTPFKTILIDNLNFCNNLQFQGRGRTAQSPSLHCPGYTGRPGP